MVNTDKQERAYHVAMGNFMADRGFLNLAQSHLVSARDCPRGCGCFGCASWAAEREEEKAKRIAAKRAAEARRAA